MTIIISFSEKEVFKLKVMVVDDSMFARQKLKEFLQEQGFEVCEADSGETAIEKYLTEKPDIVTLDITMPQMNGIDALKKIIEIDKNAKVIMITAVRQKVNVLEAITFGAKDFIVKPFVEEQLKKSIDKIVNGVNILPISYE